MSTTVMDALINAKFNFENLERMGLRGTQLYPFFRIAKAQLDNAIDALENGKTLDFVLQDYMGEELNK